MSLKSVVTTESVRELLKKQVLVPLWMDRAVEGLPLDALVEVERVHTAVGTYVLSVERAGEPEAPELCGRCGVAASDAHECDPAAAPVAHRPGCSCGRCRMASAALERE